MVDNIDSYVNSVLNILGQNPNGYCLDELAKDLSSIENPLDSAELESVMDEAKKRGLIVLRGHPLIGEKYFLR